MTDGFPHIQQTTRTGESGVNAVSIIVNDKFGWLFRRNHNEHDFGIDGYVDIVTDKGAVTGQCIAIQIKTGQSFLKGVGASGFTFYGEQKHLNYYFNLPMPVLIVIHDDISDETYWQHFELSRIEGIPTGWKMQIQKSNLLEKDKEKLLEIVGPVSDHMVALKSHWVFNESLSKFDYIHYAVDRSDIEAKSTSRVVGFFRRIEASDALCRKFQGRIDLSVSGYEADSRALWEIQEVRRWFKKVDPELNWFFFCNLEFLAGGFKTYVACLSDAKRAPDHADSIAVLVKFSMDSNRMSSILAKNFPKLNAMTDRLGMSIEVNKRISFEVLDAMGLSSG